MLHWKTKVYLDLNEKGRFSGSGGEDYFTVKDAKSGKEIMTLPSDAVTFLEIATVLINKANALIEKDKS